MSQQIKELAETLEEYRIACDEIRVLKVRIANLRSALLDACYCSVSNEPCHVHESLKADDIAAKVG